MEEISVLGLVAATLAQKSGPVPEARLFERAFLPRYSFWRGFLLSLLIHCCIVFVLIPLTYMLGESEEQVWRRHARTLHALRLQIPDRLYLTSTEPVRPKRPAPVPPAKQNAAPREVAKSESAPAPKLEAPPLLPRQFRLPDLPRRPRADQTLIQLDLPPDLALTAQVKLPQLFLTAPVLPRLAPRRFVAPGPSAPPAVAPKLTAAPQLATSTSVPSDLKVPDMLAGPQDALLRLPRPTLPHRAFQPTTFGDGAAPGRGASVSPIVGEPVNIISFSSDPAALTEQVVIPLGNQIGRLPGPPSTDPASPVGIPSAASGGPGMLPASKGVADGGGGDGDSLASANGSGGTGPGGSGAGGSGVGIALGKFTPSISFNTPIRIEHPNNATYDVIVVQSEESFSESAGVLSGKPVYTAYVKTGAPKAWIMQFCVPHHTVNGPKVAGNTVYIGKPAPLKAPYPLVTVLPPVVMLPRTSYIMVHGFVDKIGKFKDLTVLRAPDKKIAPLLVPQLAEWQFRPATRDGVPILVEILLAIPPEEG